MCTPLSGFCRSHYMKSCMHALVFVIPHFISSKKEPLQLEVCCCCQFTQNDGPIKKFLSSMPPISRTTATPKLYSSSSLLRHMKKNNKKESKPNLDLFTHCEPHSLYLEDTRDFLMPQLYSVYFNHKSSSGGVRPQH